MASLVASGLHLGTQSLPEASQRASEVSNRPLKDTKMEAKMDEKSALGLSRPAWTSYIPPEASKYFPEAFKCFLDAVHMPPDASQTSKNHVFPYKNKCF